MLAEPPTLRPYLHRQAVSIAWRHPFRDTEGDVARGNRRGTGVQDVVTLCTGPDTRFGEPSIDIAKSASLEQFSAKGISFPGLLRRQGLVCVQPQKHQFGMNLADVQRAMSTQESVNLHDLGTETPKLA